MFQIRPEHLQAFEAEAEAELVSRIAHFLQLAHRLAVNDIPSGLLLNEIRQALSRARRYGLTHESSLLDFVVLSFTVSEDFDTHPAVERVLTDPATPPNQRMSVLLDSLNEDAWDEVRSTLNPD